ncbi:unnamed protein product [Ambrosiozyma monospora]|uniref:Unnamed protein product n=1 Tax=Ambrosiozyma monospora TaxID=43982 RepID=A0ACB5SXW6_AMBMO|nr:unnamed protein product [Ambrosiozyma monospora]
MALQGCLRHFGVEYWNEFNLDSQDSVVIKCIDLISFPDWKKRQIKEYGYEPSLEEVYGEFEVAAYQRIRLYNQLCEPDDRINVPTFLVSGEVSGGKSVRIETCNGEARIICGPNRFWKGWRVI